MRQVMSGYVGPFKQGAPYVVLYGGNVFGTSLHFCVDVSEEADNR